MRTKVTLILVLLNVALFYFIFFHVRTGPEDVDAKSRVLGPETASIQSLELATGDGSKTISLEQRGAQWWITKPLEWPANQFAVERIINELKLLKDTTRWSVSELGQNDKTLADYGLEKPPLTLTFTPTAAAGSGAKPQPVSLYIGNISPVGNSLYVLSPDKKRVHVVNRSLLESLTLRVEDLRSDTLFTIPVYEVRSFNIELSPVKIRLRNDNNRWFFESPFNSNVRASKSNTVLAINALNRLRAKTFIDSPNGSQAGLSTPSLKITLEGNNRRETLLIGAPVESTAPAAPASTGSPPAVEYYAKMEDKTPVFIVAMPSEPVDLLATLRDAQNTLRDRHLLEIEESAVTAITLTAPNQPELTLQRLEAAPTNPATAAWQGVIRRDPQKGPQTFPADRELVSGLLEKLNQLTATDFVTDAPSAADREDFGFNRPVRTITLSFAPGQSGSAVQVTSTTLLIGTAAGANPRTYAKLENQDYIYAVPAEILSDTPLAPLAYRERLLHELPAGAQISALKLSDASTNTVLLDTSLPLPEPPASTTLPPEQRQAIEALAAHLRVLRAKEFVQERLGNTVTVDGQERPWRYRLEVTLTLVGGTGAETKSSTLLFSERLGGSTQYVGSPEFDLVFTAEQPLVDALFTIVNGPHDPGPASTPAPASSSADAVPANNTSTPPAASPEVKPAP